MQAIICLGSNLDNPLHQLELATAYLQEKCYVNILQKGNVTMTKPFGYEDQPDFANQLLEIETPLSPIELLVFLKSAEQVLGRKPTFKWGPRSIDLDIIFYTDKIINTEDLTIPHPGIADREYLLSLLNELIPDYIHPVLQKSVSTIYKEFQNRGGTQ